MFHLAEIDALLEMAELQDIDLRVISSALVNYTRSRTGPDDASYALSDYYADLQLGSLPPGTLEWEARKLNRHTSIIREYNVAEHSPNYSYWIQLDPRDVLDTAPPDFARAQLLTRFTCEVLGSIVNGDVYARFVTNDKESYDLSRIRRLQHEQFVLLNIGQTLSLLVKGHLLVGTTPEHTLAAFAVLVMRSPAYLDKRPIFDNLVRTHASAAVLAPPSPSPPPLPETAAAASKEEEEALLNATLDELIGQITSDLHT
jgi:hypothetical protein